MSTEHIRPIRPRRLMLGVLGVLPCLAPLACAPHAEWATLHQERVALDRARHEPPPLAGLRDVAGVIHVHTKLSHDSHGTIDDIQQAAAANHLGFVILTDHHQPKVYQQGFEGVKNGVVFIRGSEIIKGCHGPTGADCNSLLVFGINDFIDPGPLTMQQVVERIEAQHGVAFVAHPRGFTDWSVTGYDGMEIYDILDAASAHLSRVPRYFFDIWYSFDRYAEEVYTEILEEPTAYLKRWDALTQQRRVVAIAGSDAHQNLRILGRRVDPYPLSFKVVRTHLLVSGNTREQILQALRAGHAFVAFDLLAESSGTQVWAAVPGPNGAVRMEGLMGDEVEARDGLRIEVRTPLVGRVRLIKDGAPVASAVSSQPAFAVNGPGVYRVEVWVPFGGVYRPWIYTNPIYVRGQETNARGSVDYHEFHMLEIGR